MLQSLHCTSLYLNTFLSLPLCLSISLSLSLSLSPSESIYLSLFLIHMIIILLSIIPVQLNIVSYIFLYLLYVNMYVGCPCCPLLSIFSHSPSLVFSLKTPLSLFLIVYLVSLPLSHPHFLSISNSCLVQVWSTQQCEFVRTLSGHTRGIACLQYHGNLVVSGSSDCSIK